MKMEIVDKRVLPNIITYHELNYGDVFTYGGNIYMHMEDKRMVNLRTGRVSYLNPNTEVQLVCADLTITDFIPKKEE